MFIENAKKWFEINDIKRSDVNGLCEEICEYLAIDMVKHKVNLIRNFSVKSNYKVCFPIEIGIAYGDINLVSRQGNLEGFPEEVRGTVSLADCSLVSLSGSLKKADTLKLGSNHLENLDNLPDCRCLDISFNPIKDIKEIENKDLESLEISIFHLKHHEIIEIFRSVLKTNLKKIIVFQPYHSNHHKQYLHGGEKVEKVFIASLGMEHSNSKVYNISRRTMEIMVLNNDLDRDVPLFNNDLGVLKF